MIVFWSSRSEQTRRALVAVVQASARPISPSGAGSFLQQSPRAAHSGVTAVTYVIAALKILHYSVIVLPRLAITMPTSTSEGEILTLKQVAEFLKVTDRTIYRLAAAKKIPAFKVGGTWRFSKRSEEHTSELQSLMRISY